MKLLIKLLDILIPRFINEKVALIYEGNTFRILCSFKDLYPEEPYDAVGQARCFKLFGFGLFATITDIEDVKR